MMTSTLMVLELNFIATLITPDLVLQQGIVNNQENGMGLLQHVSKVTERTVFFLYSKEN